MLFLVLGEAETVPPERPHFRHVEFEVRADLPRDCWKWKVVPGGQKPELGARNWGRQKDGGVGGLG